jgi:hypothetical protein
MDVSPLASEIGSETSYPGSIPVLDEQIALHCLSADSIEEFGLQRKSTVSANAWQTETVQDCFHHERSRFAVVMGEACSNYLIEIIAILDEHPAAIRSERYGAGCYFGCRHTDSVVIVYLLRGYFRRSRSP